MEPVDIILKLIVEQVNLVLIFDDAKKIIAASHIPDEKYLVINNSVFKRKQDPKKKKNTIKNPQYLCVKLPLSKTITSKDLFVGTGKAQNDSFRIYDAKKSKSSDMLLLKPLDEAVGDEIAHIGNVIFLLLGMLAPQPAEVVEQNVKILLKPGHTLGYNPKPENGVVVHEFIVPDIADVLDKWETFETQIMLPPDEKEKLSIYFSKAMENLDNDVRDILNLPVGSHIDWVSLISEIRRSLEVARKDYQESLAKIDSDPENRKTHLFNIQRIAYSYADDISNLIDCLVSICDLKAVIYWCLVGRFFSFYKNIENLPIVIKKEAKIDFEVYKNSISAARNRSAHKSLNIQKTIKAVVPGGYLGDVTITMFLSHDRSKNYGSKIEFEDREMVEVISELTRTKEQKLPDRFWKENVKVMEEFEDLLLEFEKVLWVLFEIKAPNE